MDEQAAAKRQRFVELMAVTVTILGTGMVYLDQTAINVALPTMQVALKTDVAGFQWIIDIYILTLSVLLLIGGSLGDLYGRVRIFIIGMFIFVAASIVCGLSTSIQMLIVARAVQGVGGALLVPGGLAMINAVVAPERRGQVLGLWGTFSPLVVASGPLVGGWMVDNASWRGVFFMNIPLGLAAWFVAVRYVPETKDEYASGKLDWVGVFTLMIGLVGVLYALIEGPNVGWGNPLIMASLGAGVLGLIAFVLAEAYGRYPMMPLHLFRDRSFSGINLMTLFFYFAASSVFFFMSLNYQQVQGYTAFYAGLAGLPSTIVLISLSRQVGKLTDKIGPVPLMTVGVLVSCVGLFLYGSTGLDRSYWVSFFPATVLFGLGMVITFIPVTVVALGSLPSRYSGVASGFNNAISRIAQMVAVAVMGALLVSQFRSSLAERTLALHVSAADRAQLLAGARNLGATQPPAGLPAAVVEAVHQAIRLSFVDSFQIVMFISIGVALLSLAVMLLMVRYQPTPESGKLEGAALIPE